MEYIKNLGYNILCMCKLYFIYNKYECLTFNINFTNYIDNDKINIQENFTKGGFS
jgi:hypothetical protein